jgi:predicted GIY-YIG superfamily endonuclease
MFLVYLLINENKSYIGYTNDFLNRWKQHNNYKKGGAKYTTNNIGYWEPICIIDGFECKKEAMRCEWRLKRVKGYLNRIKNINKIIINDDKFTYKGNFINELNLKIYTKKEYKKYFDINTKELYWF